MDSVRFGRALGIGARGAVKALAGAVDAATAPNPNSRPASTSVPGAAARSGSRSNSSPTSSPEVGTTPAATVRAPIQAAARTAARTTRQARATGQDVLRGGRRFGEAVWGPVARLSGVLWLEITGAFFGIFALFAAQAAWTHRSELVGPAAHREAWTHAAVFAGMALVFGYFCVSSFVRARRRERTR